ncbi:MAG: DUF362 domain-containing protein [Candidatus Omnitrophica bacterium]|nr:DUF362 domain-containing protein [Candidatus Omnitrophota bacterium]
MKSKVYFIGVSESDYSLTIQSKLKHLLDKAGLFDHIKANDRVCVKLHFGEEGNTGFVKPEYLRIICDKLKGKLARPILSDTNTLYKGLRTNSKDHLKLAHEHGFTPENTGVEVIIPDDKIKDNCKEIEINQKFIKFAKVSSLFIDADALVGVAHFKGHIMTGFGGALKNIGMGCAIREGKLQQHSNIAPIIYLDACVACGACVEACPVKAITLKDKKAYIDSATCIGCASCLAACNYHAIDVHWASGGDTIQEKMIEYASAVLGKQKNKPVFINFCIKITKECDCLAKDDPRVVSDIGILASLDPVSLDKACLDMIEKRAGRDIFKELHPDRDGYKQLKYAAALGLGNLDYDLLSV